MNDTIKLDNSYIKLLLTDLNTIDVLRTLNIEDIEDHTTKVICRTIIGSVDALNDHLILTENQQVSNSN